MGLLVRNRARPSAAVIWINDSVVYIRRWMEISRSGRVEIKLQFAAPLPWKSFQSTSSTVPNSPYFSLYLCNSCNCAVKPPSMSPIGPHNGSRLSKLQLFIARCRVARVDIQVCFSVSPVHMSYPKLCTRRAQIVRKANMKHVPQSLRPDDTRS